MSERIQKILSQWGVVSRRQAETLILEGRVRLNGEIAILGQKADPTSDRLMVDDQLIQPMDRPDLVYLLLNKPFGVLSTCADPQGRTTVIDLLPPSFQTQGIYPVGRLDADRCHRRGVSGVSHAAVVAARDQEPHECEQECAPHAADDKSGRGPGVT